MNKDMGWGQGSQQPARRALVGAGGSWLVKGCPAWVLEPTPQAMGILLEGGRFVNLGKAR